MTPDEQRHYAAAEIRRHADSVAELDPAGADYLRALPERIWGIAPIASETAAVPPSNFEVLSREA